MLLRTLTAALLLLLPNAALAQSDSAPPAAHWPLRNSPANALQPSAPVVLRGKATVTDHADFPGSGSWIEVPASHTPDLGTADFTITAKVCCPPNDGPSGDIISQYDPATRRGFHLTLKTAAGVTSSQASLRQLHFGIDDNRLSPWLDHGRPGNALLGFAMAAHNNTLFVGTCEPDAGQAGHVYRLDAGGQWIDCGAPDQSNSVTAMAELADQLYVGTGKYRVAGSSLPESPNTSPGGRVFRRIADGRWEDCGQLPGVEAIGGLAVFQGHLHASSLYKPAGFFRLEKNGTWTTLPVPQATAPAPGTSPDRRVEAMTVWEGALYAGSYDGGSVYRWDGNSWTDLGTLGDNTQTYSFAQYDGQLYVGTWPSGRVYRFAGPNQWVDCGRLGEELEVMGMLVHNGRLLAGTLPLAEMYQYEGTVSWQKLTQLDRTPDVKYRRAWTLAELHGRLYCSTLPSGHIWSVQAGASVQHHAAFPDGWHDIAAVRTGRQLLLYIDGKQVATASIPADSPIDLHSTAPLRIGAGMNGSLNGRLRDLRIYQRALTVTELQPVQ
ncbi:MAG: LamG-like jellyroll fold domain-containing protein [Planctomyces sp.]|jgi:hypothetical protein